MEWPILLRSYPIARDLCNRLNRPRKVGFFVGSGGETVGIWLEPLGPDQTHVLVTTATTAAGRLGQKNWDNEVLAEMEKSLSKKQ
jgi:hypothetical protein